MAQTECMGEHRDRMLSGEPYQDNDPELVAERARCQGLVERFNATRHDEQDQRTKILTELLGHVGEGSWIMPRFQCDYGYLISLGSNSFLNYDAILMDCAPITIGNDVSIGPEPNSSRPCIPWQTTKCAANAGKQQPPSP